MLNVFYGAFSPACFALLGLWLVIVQIRLREWQGSAVHRRRAYGVALHFALPGIMSLLALVNPQDSAFWRISFAIIAFGGAIVLATVRGFPGRAAGRARLRPPLWAVPITWRPFRSAGPGRLHRRHSHLCSHRDTGFQGWIGRTAHRGHPAHSPDFPGLQRCLAAAVRRPLSLAPAAAGHGLVKAARFRPPASDAAPGGLPGMFPPPGDSVPGGGTDAAGRGGVRDRGQRLCVRGGRAGGAGHPDRFRPAGPGDRGRRRDHLPVDRWRSAIPPDTPSPAPPHGRTPRSSRNSPARVRRTSPTARSGRSSWPIAAISWSRPGRGWPPGTPSTPRWATSRC